MFSLELRVPQPDRDLVFAELWERGVCGIVETRDGARAFFEDDARQAEMEAAFRRYGAVAAPEPNRDWTAVARAQWEPLEVGERFFLAPDWSDVPTPAGRLRVSINPGLACGSGRHEATQLCLERLERNLRPGIRVLDVGTGAGILAVAAVLLGASTVAACDTDAEAAGVAAERTRRWGERIHLFCGSIEAVRGRSADLVVANINAPVVAALAAGLWGALRPGGVLLVSGFEDWEAGPVGAALSAAGVSRVEPHRKGSWALLEAAKDPA